MVVGALVVVVVGVGVVVITGSSVVISGMVVVSSVGDVSSVVVVTSVIASFVVVTVSAGSVLLPDVSGCDRSDENAPFAANMPIIAPAVATTAEAAIMTASFSLSFCFPPLKLRYYL